MECSNFREWLCTKQQRCVAMCFFFFNVHFKQYHVCPLKTEGAVQKTGGAESQLSTHSSRSKSALHFSSLPLSPNSSCLTPASPLPPLPHPSLCSGWLSGDPASPLNSYTGTLQRSNLEQLPTMKYLAHRRDVQYSVSVCRERLQRCRMKDTGTIKEGASQL